LGCKLAIARRCRQAFSQEFDVDKATRIRLGNKFRSERKGIEEIFRAAAENANGAHDLAPGFAVLRNRSERIASAALRLHALAGEGRLGTSLDDLASSFLHMHANRLLRSAHRAQELVLYDFLERLYEGRLARAKESPPVLAMPAGVGDAALRN